MNEKQNESSFPFGEIKVYRFNRLYRVYHLVVGTAALVGAVLVHSFLILSILLVLFSVFMIARPLVMAVTVDQSSVTYKGLFSQKSIRHSSITAVETKLGGRSRCLILWGDIDQREALVIPDLFAFDEGWDHWWSSYRDLSDNKPISLF
jgi:hypothetical protein